MPFPPLLLLLGRRAWSYSLQALRLLMIFLLSHALCAQTVRGIVDDNIVKGPGKKAKGKIEYINDTLDTVTVTLDTQSFTVSDIGDMLYRPLDSNIHVRFSATSFRIPPKQNYLVFYEAYADAIPSWFVVYATFAGFKQKTAEGLNFQILLPHTVYLLPKENVKKDELVIKTARYDPGSKVVTVRVENTGPTFCRVLTTDVTSANDKADMNGFPLFPHSERQVEIPWSGKDGPRKLTLQLEHFRLEQNIGPAMP